MPYIRPWVFGIAGGVALNLSGVCLADTLAARPSFSGTTVGFVAAKAYTNGTLTVAGPNGFAASVASKGGLPSLNLARSGPVADGQYTYQLTAATGQLDTSVTVQNNGRAKANLRPRKGVALSGGFQVKGGSIVTTLAATASRRGGRQDQD